MTRAELREELAKCIHQAWSSWLKYLISQSSDIADHTGQATGEAVLPEWLMHECGYKMITPFDELADRDQERNLKEADKFLKVIDKFMNGGSL